MWNRVVGGLALLILLGLLALWHYVTLPGARWDRILPLGKGDPLPAVVRPGMSGREAASEFEAAGIVGPGKAVRLARWMARFSIDRSLRPGTYFIRKGSPWEVARQLEAAKSATISVTIVPGTDLYSLPGGISSEPLTKDQAEKLLMTDELYPKEMIPLLPDSAEGRIPFLFPETYYVAEKRAEEVLSSAAALWWNRVGKVLSGEQQTKDGAEKLAISASLVEREGFWDDERPRIAGVIENRLKKDMLLQIDATVVYAWKREGRTLTRVLHKDLEIDSPYNTYKKPGLPPTAICMPSGKSWSAVLAPETTDYLYYVAQADKRHLFARNYDEHLRNIRSVRGK